MFLSMGRLSSWEVLTFFARGCLRILMDGSSASLTRLQLFCCPCERILLVIGTSILVTEFAIFASRLSVHISELSVLASGVSVSDSGCLSLRVGCLSK